MTRHKLTSLTLPSTPLLLDEMNKDEDSSSEMSNATLEGMSLLSMLRSTSSSEEVSTSSISDRIESSGYQSPRRPYMNGETSLSLSDEPEDSGTQSHRLEYEWTFWITNPDEDWYNAIERIGSFSTANGFWELFNILKSPSENHHYTYNLFKTGIRPEWEDPANSRGGKWSIRQLFVGDRVDPVWLDLCLLCVGGLELGQYSSYINGVYVTLKNGASRVSVWFKTTEKDIVIPAGQIIQNCLVDSLKYKFPMDFTEFRGDLQSKNKRLYCL